MSGLVAMIAVIAATLVPNGSPAAAAFSSGPWIMKASTNSYCLAPEGFTARAGAIVDQHLCELGSNRNWTFQPISAGYYRIKYRNGGLCMGVQGSSLDDRAKINMDTCGNPSLNDQWLPIGPLFTRGGVDYYLLKNRRSAKCLAVEGNSRANGADMMQYICYRTSENEAFTWNLADY